MIRSFLGFFPFLALSALATSADADESAVTSSHRVTGALGAAFTLAEPGEDGHWHQSGLGAGARLAYAYRVSNALELGLGATYFRVGHDDGPDLVLPAASVRVQWPIGDGGAEFGLSGRLGATIMRIYDVHHGITWDSGTFD